MFGREILIILAALITTSFAGPVEFRIETADPLYIVAPDTVEPVRVSATNRGDALIAGDLRVSVETFDGAKREVSERIELHAMKARGP